MYYKNINFNSLKYFSFPFYNKNDTIFVYLGIKK